MAADLQHGARRNRPGRGYVPMSQINVTPLVDVMLVLLVVFMITAPLLSVGVPVDLPETRADSLQGSEEPLTISIQRGGTIFLQEREVSFAELIPTLQAIASARSETGRIYVRADRALDYGSVMQVMGALNSAGFKRVALVADDAQAR